MKKYIMVQRLLISFLAIFSLFWSCKRDVDSLGSPKLSHDPEVFIDGFSSGLNYAAFSNSVVTAFTVDKTNTYNNSTASMKIEVPDINDPRGAYAGGTYFTSVGRDLSTYNVLSFWAKASKAAEIDVVGFGNDLGLNKYITILNAVKVNTNWQKYYIPILDASLLKDERGMFFYSEGPENDRGYTLWFDEVKFENLGTLGHLTSGIMESKDVTVSAEIGEKISMSGFQSIINLPNGLNQVVSTSAGFYKFKSSDENVATVDEKGTITVKSQGTALITAQSNGTTSLGSLLVKAISALPQPSSPAPIPDKQTSNVLSLFSNKYTNVPVDTWNTHWQFSTAEESFIQIQNDDVIKYKNLNFVGIELVSQTLNVSTMTHFHIDIWTPDNTDLPKSFKILLVDFGPNNAYGGNDDSSHELSFTKPKLATGQWISFDIPLSNFSGLTRKNNLAQLVLSGDLPNVYIDNVYFYKADTQVPDAPTAAPSAPTYPAADVISIYSDSYTNVANSNLNPNWGQSTRVSELNFNNNRVLKFAGLNYQGIQIGSNQNVSNLGFLHLDFWSSNASNLNVYIISPGPVEKPVSLTVPTTGWSSIDIPLSSFAPVDLSKVMQFKFEGNGDIYIDNIYFRR